MGQGTESCDGYRVEYDPYDYAESNGWMDGEAVCGKEEIYIADVVYQDYGSEFGVAPHCAVQYYFKGQGWPCYEYFSSREEAYAWARKHGWPN